MSSVNDSIPKQTAFQRWNIHHRLHHIGIYTSFLLCAITGLPIKFHYKAWAQSLASFFGGGDGLLAWHIFGGTIVFAASFYHVGYLIYYAITKKQLFSAGMFQFKKAFGKDLIDHFKYNLGFTDKRPNYGRYSWKEFFDYWAVFWGMFIIGGSGVMMVFPEWTLKYFPRWIVDSYRMGHSDEAVLAVLVIFIWHFFNVHFNPDFFPMSWTWWDGKMSLEVMMHEHPDELAEILASQETGKTDSECTSQPESIENDSIKLQQENDSDLGSS